MDDLISRQAAIDAMTNTLWHYPNECYRNLNEYEFAKGLAEFGLKSVPSAQPEDYAELKREFLRMASYIDVLLECSDEQKETLIGFISRLAEFMPWTERD